MDAQWIDEFQHALRVTAGGKKEGYYSDFNGISNLAEAFNHGYVYHGQYSQQRDKSFGADPAHNPGEQFVVFSQNHDQVGNRMLGERSSQLFSFEMQKLMAATVFVSPFLPMLFMGEEYSEPNPFLYFVSHTEPELIEAVRKGRKEEFAAFHAEGEAPDPQAEETFSNSKLSWHLLSQPPHQTMLEYYKALINLRKKHPALRIPDRDQGRAQANHESRVLSVFRSQAGSSVLCLLNFSKEEQQANVSQYLNSKIIFNSADRQWNGPVDQANVRIDGSTIKLPPESIIILEQHV